MLTKEQVERLALIKEHHYCTVSDYGFCKECELIKIIDTLTEELADTKERMEDLYDR